MLTNQKLELIKEVRLELEQEDIYLQSQPSLSEPQKFLSTLQARPHNTY